MPKFLYKVFTAATPFQYIGKETDRRWEQGEDISMLDSKPVEYRPNETARLVADSELQHAIQQVSIRELAKTAKVSDNTVKAARRGDRMQKSTVEKLKNGLNALLRKPNQAARTMKG